MSLDAGTLEKLMAFADGELEGAERAEIEALVQSNDDAKRIVQELGVLGDCIRITEAARPARADHAADGIAEAVMGKIAREKSNVVDLASRRRNGTLVTVAALVAAAAGVMFIARGGDEPQPTAKAQPTAVEQAPVATPPATQATGTAQPLVVASAEPKAEESPSNASVIVVPGEGETASSIVIWLGEESAGGALK